MDGAPARTPEVDVQDVEVRVLIEALYDAFGQDFRDYAFASLKRRVLNVVRSEHLPTVSALQDRVLHNAACRERLLLALTVNVSAFFRDAAFFRAFRGSVVPLLRTYPFVRIWCAGCASGEEAYSLAILLHEEGLYERCRIYATDVNEAVLAKAREGIYPLDAVQELTLNYAPAGGRAAASDYYTAAYDRGILRSWLRQNLLFSQHNLVTDGSFNEFHVIVCRNVLIYFNRTLQARVHGLFLDSLARFGFLALGSKESLRLTPHESAYEPLDAEQRIYRRTT